MSEQSLELLDRIRGRLNAAARRTSLADVLFGIVLTSGLFSGIWALSAGLEAGFWLGTLPRTILFWSVLVLCIGLFLIFIALPLLRFSGLLPGPSPKLIATRISDRFPQVGDRLINLLDLSEGRRSDAPEELVDGAVQMLGREVDPVPLEDVEDFGRAKRAVRIAAFPVLAILIFLTAAPSTFMDASRRILSPGVHFDQPAPFRLFVEPGSIELARGSGMEISVRGEGSAVPRSLVLSINNLDEEHVEDIRLSPDSTGVFRHKIANVRKSFRYRVQASPVTTTWYRTAVTEHPLVRNLQVTLTYPSYSGVPAQQLDPNVGDVSGLPGSRANLEVALGGSEASQARIEFDQGEPETMDIDDGVAKGAFTLTRSGRYRIVLENNQGVKNRDPINYSINLVSDASPSVVLVRPESDALLNEDLRPHLQARISDDYGFHDLTLFYRLAESRFGETSDTFSLLELPLESPRSLDQDVPYDWVITQSTDLDPVPGDVIEYYVRVRDNDTFAGYKSAETPVQRLRLPSLAEQYEQLHEEQDEVESEMEDLARQAENLDEQFQKLRDEIRSKQDADWEDKRQIEQIQEQQRQLEQRVDDLSQQVESMNNSARQNNLLGEETLEMYEEMQKVVEEINSPELMEALRQLQQSMEEMNLSEMQQAIEDFEFNEDQYRDRLERALELFKNLRTQQALEEAARRAEELAKQQENLAEKTAEMIDEERQPADERSDEKQGAEENPQEDAKDPQRSSESDQEGENQQDATKSDEGERQEDANASEADRENPQDANDSGEKGGQQQGQDQESRREDLAREQELSREEMRQLEELLDKLQQQSEELKKGPAEEMNRLNQAVKQQQIPQEMQRNAEQLRKNQLQDAQSGQQQMQQQLQQLQNQLSQMQSNMQGSQMQVNMSGLRRSLSDVLTLSKQQEDLRDGLRNNVSEAPALRTDARRQVELSEGLSTVVDSLQKLSKNIPQMSREVQRQAGQALREMGRATESMTERSVAQSAGHQKASMMHLNELALLLSEVMNQLMNASGSGSGSGNMQQMIQQMQEAAQQQQQLNKQIQQFLNDMQGNRLSIDAQQRLQQMAAQQRAVKKQLDEIRRNPEARGNLLGDLEKIGRQMEETIGELERRQIEPRMIERQQQILQRLLDAQRSIHQRGQEDKRQAQEGQDVQRQSPDDLPPEEAAEKLRRDLIRALESGYAPDYEELIKRYFELLQQQRSTQE